MQTALGVATRRPIPIQPTEDQRAWARAVQLAYPGISVACGVSFEDIWQLFLDSGFLYPEKIARLEPVLPEIRQTVRSLIESNGHCFATVVLKEKDTTDAHMSILQSHRKTWMVQHLAAMPLSARHSDASARLTLGFTYYGRLRPDIVWVKMFFRPNNPWPKRVFGGFAAQIAESGTSDFRRFHYFVGSTSTATPQLRNGVAVRDAHVGDIDTVVNWFRSRGREVEAAANDLVSSELELGSVSSRYAAVGLQRRRECVVAEAGGQATGFALLDVSSLGINLSELTNAFTVHVLEDDAQATRSALIEEARRRYGRIGRTQCVALEESSDVAALEAAGFTTSKDYCCFTFHRDHLEQMEEYFQTLFTMRRRTAE